MVTRHINDMEMTGVSISSEGWGDETRVRHERQVTTEMILNDPSRAASLFFLAGGLAGLSVLPDWHGTHNSLPALFLLIGCAFIFSAALWFLRDEITLGGLQVFMLLAVVAVCLANSIEPRPDANIGVLYVWAAVYSAVYFSRNALIFQNVCAGVGYLIVLLAAHEQSELLFSSWIFVTGTCVLLSTIIYGLVGIFRRISREDPLTRLANRRSWDERLEEEIGRARRTTLPLSIIAIDIDNFKSVNDRDGHQGGDRVLRKFANEWLEAVRGSGDFVARLGVDEFAVLAPGASEAGLNVLVQRIRAIEPNGVTCALGTATWNGVESASELMHRADQSMYENKPR